MSRICEITWKRTSTWNNRSHSMRATKRKFMPNLFYKKVKDPTTWIVYRIKVSAAWLRTLRKKWII